MPMTSAPSSSARSTKWEPEKELLPMTRNLSLTDPPVRESSKRTFEARIGHVQDLVFGRGFFRELGIQSQHAHRSVDQARGSRIIEIGQGGRGRRGTIGQGDAHRRAFQGSEGLFAGQSDYL